MKQGLLGQDRSTDLLSSSALLCRRMVEPTSLSLTAQLAENSRKIVGKLLCFLPWLYRKVTVTSSLASVQPAGVAEGCMTATPSSSLLATPGWAMQRNKNSAFSSAF